MPAAARTARRASSSWAAGTPKTAWTASPTTSTVPPWCSTTARMASYQRAMTWDTDSGSSRSPMAVEPLRSLTTTVTALRVPPGRPAQAGRGSPQARQNRARRGFGSPQVGQPTVCPGSPRMPDLPHPRGPGRA
jgi:hypothetical protein